MLIILEDRDKPRTTDDVDRMVFSEIPDHTKDPVLYDLVSTHMIHKCTAICAEADGTCNKNFPKSYCETTSFGDDCFPSYKRSNNGRNVMTADRLYDNRSVVPYNAYLLLKYDVEICTSVKAVKYLYKYIFKGIDRTTVAVADHQGRRLRR